MGLSCSQPCERCVLKKGTNKPLVSGHSTCLVQNPGAVVLRRKARRRLAWIARLWRWVCLPGGSSLAVYANDTTLYKYLSSGDSIQNASSNLQQAVDAVAAWGSSWKIQFEPTKSQALTLSSHRPPIALPSIYFNIIPVAEEDEIKLLGVTFDRQLSFRSHFRNVSSKANQRLHFFKKVAPLLSVPGKLAVYEGFVRPTMEYTAAWCGWVPQHPPDRDRAQTFKINVHRHILHSSWLAATHSL